MTCAFASLASVSALLSGLRGCEWPREQNIDLTFGVNRAIKQGKQKLRDAIHGGDKALKDTILNVLCKGPVIRIGSRNEHYVLAVHHRAL